MRERHTYCERETQAERHAKCEKETLFLECERDTHIARERHRQNDT